MSLSSLSIKRPVLATVSSILIIIFGIIGYTYLGIREYPSVDPPIISISTGYTGANAEIIETQITEPLEEAINGIPGIRTITSTSREGRSNISVEFTLGTDLETAANDVRDKTSGAINLLPLDADPPVVSKADADASPIVQMTVNSSTRDLTELSDIANNVFKERLQTIPGVSQIQIWGEKRYAMRLWLDPQKLSAYKLTPLDIRSALNRENIELPSGRIEGGATELTIRTLGRLKTEDDFNNLILKEDNGNVIRLRDVGQAKLGPENERTMLKLDGIPMVGLSIIPQPGSNHIEIANQFYKMVETLKKDLPSDIQLGMGFDYTKHIRRSISEVEETVLLAFALVIIIIFMFLRDWRTTIIPVIAIPISLIGAFFIMYLFNFSINVLSLLGIVLAIGLVVDDAIVVLENIYAKVELGMHPIEAGLKGSHEIFFAIVSTTVTLAAVFLPIIFLEGLTGKLFREFGIVIAGSVLISAFVALTLTPMLSTKILKPHSHHNWLYRKTEPFFERMTTGYAGMLESFLKRRWLTFIVIAVSLGIIVLIGMNLQSELAPMEDRSLIRINSTAQEGASYDFMSEYMDKFSQAVGEAVPERDLMMVFTSPGYGSSGGANSGMVRLMLKDPDQRNRSQMQIADELSKLARRFTDARSVVSQEQSISISRGGLPVQYVLQAPNFEKLQEALPKFLDIAQKDPTFSVVDFNLKFNKPEILIRVDRDKAKDLGVSVTDIAQILQASYSGQRFGYFEMNGKQYQILAQVERAERSEPLDLTSLYVKNDKGELIQLDNVVSMKEQINPPQRFHYNRYTSATVMANLAPGKSMSDGIAAMDRIAKQVLDESFSTALSGPSKDFAESSSSLMFVFMLAIVLIYLILAAQFESFRDPLIIMFTVPLAIAGALLSLWYFNQTLNIFSEIGMIMLIGLVTKNGILIVEFANQRKKSGMGIMEAVKDASVSRLRPILMTSFATVLGTLPIALALGAGSESRVSMGIVVIGGLMFSTILTLFIIPAIYSYLSDNKRKTEDIVEEYERTEHISDEGELTVSAK